MYYNLLGIFWDKRSYLYWIELDAVYSVNTPCETPHRFSSVLIPDVDLFSTCGKHGFLPVMINAVVEILQRKIPGISMGLM